VLAETGKDKPKTTKAVLRNVSYQKANADSFATDCSGMETPLTGPPPPAVKARTINGGRVDTVMIETDASQHSASVSSRPLSSSVLLHREATKKEPNFFFVCIFFNA